MKKAIIFDLDGTLIDSGVVILKVLNKIRREREFSDLTMDCVRPHLSKGGLRLVSCSLGEASGDEAADLVLFRKYYSTASQGEEIVFDGVRFLLDGLTKAGFRLGICTNKPRRLCDNALYETGLASYFSAIISAGETLPAKPDPASYLQCCAELDVHPENTILVGDSEVDRDTALAAGAEFILVTYGYPIGAIETIDAAAKCDEPIEIARSIGEIFAPTTPVTLPLSMAVKYPSDHEASDGELIQ